MLLGAPSDSYNLTTILIHFDKDLEACLSISKPIVANKKAAILSRPYDNVAIFMDVETRHLWCEQHVESHRSKVRNQQCIDVSI